MYDILQLNDMILPELRELADKLKVKGSDKLEKKDLILKVLDAQALHPQAEEDTDKQKDKMKKQRTRKPIDPELKTKLGEKEGTEEVESHQKEEAIYNREVSAQHKKEE